MCTRVGGVNTISFLAAHFAKRSTKFGGCGKKTGIKVLFKKGTSGVQQLGQISLFKLFLKMIKEL